MLFGRREEFGAVARGGGEGGFHEGGLGGGIERGRRSGSRGDDGAKFAEKFFLAGGGADAEHARGAGGRVVKLVRGVGGDVDGVAGADGALFAAEGGFEFAVEEDEGLLEIVAMRGRAAVGRDEHVDKAEFAGGVCG